MLPMKSEHAGSEGKARGLGVEIVSPDRRTPEYLAEFVKSEIEKWKEPILKSGTQVD